MRTSTVRVLCQSGKILANKKVSKNFREMKVQWIAPNPLPEPGQFFMLRPGNWPMPILCRPFAYSDADNTAFSFIFELRGMVTTELDALKAGESIDWIGPLGTSFPLKLEDGRPVLVSGGVGIGPINYLANFLSQRKVKPVIITGFRTENAVPELIWPNDAEIHICTEDGSTGIKGTVMDAVQILNLTQAVLYSCGPRAMLKAVHNYALKSNCPAWVSVEELMACGVGNCQSCAIPVVSGQKQTQYKRACMEGPVFDSRNILWI